jgi:hypothetical protein
VGRVHGFIGVKPMVNYRFPRVMAAQGKWAGGAYLWAATGRRYLQLISICVLGAWLCGENYLQTRGRTSWLVGVGCMVVSQHTSGGGGSICIGW